MTEQQLYLSIGVPTLVVLIGILVNVGYFVALNGRINSLETRLDGRINSFENRLEGSINSFGAKLDSWWAK